MFGEKGYQGVTVGEIAETAGVAKGLVNYYFGSKENLLDHVLSQNRVMLFAQLDSITRLHQSAAERIRAAVEIYLTIASTGPALARMAMMAVFDAAYPENIQKIWITSMEQSLGKFRELLDEGVANGEFKSMDSRLVTQFVMAMAFEVLRDASLRQEPLNPHKAADQITKVLFEGIMS